jgi:hypothetical protein
MGWRARDGVVVAALFIVLTALTQIGGVVYLAVAAATRRLHRTRALGRGRRALLVTVVSVGLYAVLTWAAVPPLAAAFGRVRLPCGADGDVAAASWLTCALNRGFVTPTTRAFVGQLGSEMARQFPGSQVTTLEGGFPFIKGFPLPPHLSHRDGRKVDLAFFYRRADTGAPIAHGSPSRLGYFVYEPPLPSEITPCAGRWTPLRWDFSWFQPAHPAWRLDDARTAAMIAWLKDQAQVTRLFIEPHLAQRLGVAGDKVRFQGCHAARHDDHIHLEIQ